MKISWPRSTGSAAIRSASAESSVRGGIHCHGAGERNLLFGTSAAYEAVPQYRGDYYVHYRLYFSPADPGHGQCALRQRLQHYSEKYRKQPEDEAQALEDILKKDIDGLIIEPSKSSWCAVTRICTGLWKSMRSLTFLSRGSMNRWRPAAYPDGRLPGRISGDQVSAGSSSPLHRRDF